MYPPIAESGKRGAGGDFQNDLKPTECGRVARVGVGAAVKPKVFHCRAYANRSTLRRFLRTVVAAYAPLIALLFGRGGWHSLPKRLSGQ